MDPSQVGLASVDNVPVASDECGEYPILFTALLSVWLMHLPASWDEHREYYLVSATLRWQSTSLRGRTTIGLSKPIHPVSNPVVSLCLVLIALSAGQYRVAYFGDSKPLIGSIKPFVGYSSVFTVV